MTTLRALRPDRRIGQRARSDLIVATFGALLLMLWDLSGLDLMVTGWFGSPLGFALRDAWWTRNLLHEGGRLLSLGLLFALIWDCWRPIAHGPARRLRLLWLAATVACVSLVSGLKQVSTTSCPWDLSLFGGVARHVSHWQWGLADGGGGHCFPSGHAVGAFAFISTYFLWRDHRPPLARALLGSALLLGGLFGLAQLARGAHYPSHTLWSAWLCWALCALWSWGLEVAGDKRLSN